MKVNSEKILSDIWRFDGKHLPLQRRWIKPCLFKGTALGKINCIGI